MVSLDHERRLWDDGATLVAGIDEVGRGALAGPVSVGVCVVGRCDTWPAGLADSKALSPAARTALIPMLAGFGVGVAVGHVPAARIDQVGIVVALREAAHLALDELAARGVVPDAVILDGSHNWLAEAQGDLFEQAPSRTAPRVRLLVKADAACASVAAASVAAKVARDALMTKAHEAHPEYGWNSNKGYGSATHLDALARIGPSGLHRLSWRLPGVGSA